VLWRGISESQFSSLRGSLLKWHKLFGLRSSVIADGSNEFVVGSLLKNVACPTCHSRDDKDGSEQFCCDP
jgi:hypothetical protein